MAEQNENTPQKPSPDRSKMQVTYSNYMMVALTGEEVIFEFGMRNPDNLREIDILQRIVTSIPHAVRMKDVLDRHLPKLAASPQGNQVEAQGDAREEQ